MHCLPIQHGGDTAAILEEIAHAIVAMDHRHALSGWRETPFFSDKERAALEWTEAVTLVSSSHVADSVYDSCPDPEPMRIWRINADGTDHRPLTPGPGDYLPSWRPAR